MLKRQLMCALLFSMGSISMIQSTVAATIVIEYTGTVASGTDVTGVFDAPNTSLESSAFTSVSTLTNPETGGDINGLGLDLKYGGASYGAPSPLSAQLAINGVSQSFDGSFYSEQILSMLSCGTSQVFDIEYGAIASTHPVNNIYSKVHSNVNSLNHADALHHAVQSGDLRNRRVGPFDEFGRNDGVSCRCPRNTHVDIAYRGLRTGARDAQSAPPGSGAYLIGRQSGWRVGRAAWQVFRPDLAGAMHLSS